jgi:hypothetical protein
MRNPKKKAITPMQKNANGAGPWLKGENQADA